MKKWLILLALALTACMGGEDVTNGGTREKIRPGFYEEKVNATFSGTFLDLIAQFRFSANGTYSNSIFLGQQEVVQYKGKWNHSGNQVYFSEKLAREMNDNGSWGPWMSVPDDFDQIRNVTETSYQYYFDFEKAFTAEERAEISGLSSGWRTCNRIGD